jgi:glycine cleavage system transcriptional repressor
MKKHAILSVLGPDRVGIAHDLAATLGRQGLDIETSRMTALQGRFAVLMAISGEQSSVKNLRLNLPRLGADLGFDLRLDPLETIGREKAAPRAARRTGRVMLIESFTAEPSGLNAITEILKRRCVNVEELEADVSSDPCTSGLTFYMRARVEVPDSCSADWLGEELRELRKRCDIDVVVKRGCEIADPRVLEEVR